MSSQDFKPASADFADIREALETHTASSAVYAERGAFRTVLKAGGSLVLAGTAAAVLSCAPDGRDAPASFWHPSEPGGEAPDDADVDPLTSRRSSSPWPRPPRAEAATSETAETQKTPEAPTAWIHLGFPDPRGHVIVTAKDRLTGKPLSISESRDSGGRLVVGIETALGASLMPDVTVRRPFGETVGEFHGEVERVEKLWSSFPSLDYSPLSFGMSDKTAETPLAPSQETEMPVVLSDQWTGAAFEKSMNFRYQNEAAGARRVAVEITPLHCSLMPLYYYRGVLMGPNTWPGEVQLLPQECLGIILTGEKNPDAGLEGETEEASVRLRVREEE